MNKYDKNKLQNAKLQFYICISHWYKNRHTHIIVYYLEIKWIFQVEKCLNMFHAFRL